MPVLKVQKKGKCGRKSVGLPVHGPRARAGGKASLQTVELEGTVTSASSNAVRGPVRLLNSKAHYRRAIKFHQLKAKYASEFLMRVLLRNQDFQKMVGLDKVRRGRGGVGVGDGDGSDGMSNVEDEEENDENYQEVEDGDE